MKISAKKITDALAITGSNVYNSVAIPLDYLMGYAIVISTTSTATGTAKLQASLDGVVWVDLPNSGATASIAVSGAGNSIWNVTDAYYPQVRVVYTNATSSGTLSVSFSAKGW